MTSLTGRTIAVVEDEATIREAICAALRREGYGAEAFDDGLRAWEAFERALPDVAILDIGVPRLDGLDLCRRLRARSERSQSSSSRRVRRNSIVSSVSSLGRTTISASHFRCAS